jgi:putative transcriptional regulator
VNKHLDIYSYIVGMTVKKTWDNQSTEMAEMVCVVRKRLGLSQEKFAAKIGVSFSTVNRWEHHRAVPSPLALKQIRELLERMGDRGHDLLERYFLKELELSGEE